MGCCVSAKIRRTLEAGGLVALLGVAALMVAQPFVDFGTGDAPLDPVPPLYADLESERPATAVPVLADSELADRTGRPVQRVLAVGGGDTMMDILLRAGVDATDANAAIDALLDVYNPRSLKAGQRVTVSFDASPHGFGRGEFRAFALDPDPIRSVAVTRGDRGFAGKEAKRPVTKTLAHFTGTIKSSLFESAQTAGVPPQMIVGMIRALSYDVDFQRDIQSGDAFEVLFEGWADDTGRLVRQGEMLYAAVTLSGKPIALYRFENGTGVAEYFNDKGESIKKALLRTPVDGAKITSGFGMRNHPILGYSKMHKGIDFGVPTGTPINAAGDGMIEIAGFNGAYGNYVRVRHTNNYATAYAHMSRIAAGIHAGKRVGQGQIVGFVGSTGRSTGPHLHYEVMVGNTQVNPLSIKMPTGTKLAGRDLDRFKGVKGQIEDQLARTPANAHIAQAGAKTALPSLN
ncbi:MAG: peptidoglycan DD-metalloendopeptidase family protein [Magnetospirillum sp.]|nr:peptidoglycan DD-metalloendopeptidase family protein [Magnetospirillum sp.]